MMIKYRVHDVAKDLNIPNKEVIDTIQKYCGETKKHMTALTEQELNRTFTGRDSIEHREFLPCERVDQLHTGSCRHPLFLSAHRTGKDQCAGSNFLEHLFQRDLQSGERCRQQNDVRLCNLFFPRHLKSQLPEQRGSGALTSIGSDHHKLFPLQKITPAINCLEICWAIL